MMVTGEKGILVEIFPDRQSMGKAAAVEAAKRINEIIEKKGEACALFSAAPSQNEFLEELMKTDIDFSKMRAMHLDEYIGLPEDAPQGFGNFLDRAIFTKVNFKAVHYLYGKSKEESIERYTKLLAEYPPDIVFLGVGENGHIAFNDPPVADFNDPYKVKVVELDEVCRNQQVNDGCFKAINEVPTHAITLTVPQLFEVPQILIIVPGPTKANAVAGMLEGPISTSCPASILRKHEDAMLYIDVNSAAKLKKREVSKYVVGV